MNKHKLIEQCELTLHQNDLGAWTRPAPGLYPHQWLWDSCFVAIGLRHTDLRRAQTEIDSLFRGQWKNGMLPNIINGEGDYYADKLWDGHSPDMPKGVRTSGITQPPLIAEAMVRIGTKLPKNEKLAWYKKHINQLAAYHEWLYRERDPKKTGLVALIHPWESGIDNSPAWMEVVHNDSKPFWIKAGQSLGLTGALEHMRKDTKFVPASERIETVDALLLFHHAKRIVHKKYDNQRILNDSKIALYDVLFNSILIRNNTLLKEIADELGVDLPSWLQARMKLAEKALDSLWNNESNLYFDKKFQNTRFVKAPSIGRYLPLYSGAISHTRARQLARQLNAELSQTDYPVATIPPSSKLFNQHRYWQGPAWVNTNWLIIDGLRRYGFDKLADDIRERTLHLIWLHGPHEYFSPIDGSPAGAHQFSWSAALAIDLANQ